MLVLSCAAGASETRLAYAALADLLAEIDGEPLDSLPPPQREALGVALLRVAPSQPAVDQRAVATAALSLLERLARDQPVLIAIDDLQWLDRPSGAIVEFCARRLKGRVGLLASQRPGEVSVGAPRDLSLRDPDRAEVRGVEPLAAPSIERLLRERAPRGLSRRAVAQVQATAAGNPFYALELARSLQADGPPSAAPALPASLDERIASRMAGWSEAVQAALLAVALLADPTVELLEEALGPGAAAALDEAEEQGQIVLDGPRLRFAHPLLAAGVQGRASAPGRRQMHRQLAAIVPDLEERARHLAFAGAGSEAVPALDAAARYARARGAPDAAADLLDLALEFDDGPQRRLLSAQHHFDAGDPRRARSLLEGSIPALPDGEAKGRALLLLAETHYKDDSFPAAQAVLERARSEADSDERLRVTIDLRLAFTHFNLLGPDAAVAATDSALAGAERLGDPTLLAQALAAKAMVDFLRGRGVDERRLEMALELEGPDLRAPSEFHPSLIASFVCLWTGELDESRRRLTTLWERHADRGDEHALAWASFIRVWLECWAGDLTAAAQAADDASERLLRLGTVNGRALALAAHGQLGAHLGRDEETRRQCEEAIALFERSGWQAWVLMPQLTLGFLDLSLGRPAAAAARLGPLAVLAVSTGLPEPTAGPMLLAADAAEALIAVGRPQEAEPIVALLEVRGEELGRHRTIAVAARCRALLLAAAAELAEAEDAAERALAAGERLPMPIEHARSLLVLGRIQRRRRKRLAAKAALTGALALFEEAGSPRWAEQASAEIECLGLRQRSDDGLTPSEERVARLAGSGLTNHEVAAALVVSPKTVEAHLARAYRKLGIRSRAELGARMADDPHS